MAGTDDVRYRFKTLTNDQGEEAVLRRLSIPMALITSVLAMSAGVAGPEDSTRNNRSSIVNDLPALHAFVQARPTPEEFQQAYPDVWLILPGDIVTREVCSQYYRFVAELDAEGRISGGNLE